MAWKVVVREKVLGGGRVGSERFKRSVRRQRGWVGTQLYCLRLYFVHEAYYMGWRTCQGDRRCPAFVLGGLSLAWGVFLVELSSLIQVRIDGGG